MRVSTPLSSAQPTTVYSATFNDDKSLFGACTDDGYDVYQTAPLRLLARHDFSPPGTLSVLAPYLSTSLLLLTGGPPSPAYAPNKLVLLSAPTRKPLAEIEFPERVRAVTHRRGWLAVAVEHAVLGFAVPSLERTGMWETASNARGLMAVSTAAGATVLALPGRKLGDVQIHHLPPRPPSPPPQPSTSRSPTSPDRPASPPTRSKGKAPAKSTSNPHATTIFHAHETPLAALALTRSGDRLATTSERGTLVRVWDTRSGTRLWELRRGTDPAVIWQGALEFSLCGTWIAVVSEKGTVHVWKLDGGAERKESGGGGSPAGREVSSTLSTPNPLTSLLTPHFPALKRHLPAYFSSRWSSAHFRLPQPNPHAHTLSGRPEVDERAVLAWIEVGAPGEREPQLVVVTLQGGWYRLGMPRDGEREVGEDGEAEEAAPGGGTGMGRRLRLEEFRRWGKRDEWH